MVVEIAVGTAVSWLWGKLADSAEAKDYENAIKIALQESIDQSFNQFQNKYGDKSESFFNQEFIENHACPEILKYLTRHQQPDLDAINQALPVIALFSSELHIPVMVNIDSGPLGSPEFSRWLTANQDGAIQWKDVS